MARGPKNTIGGPVMSCETFTVCIFVRVVCLWVVRLKFQNFIWIWSLCFLLQARNSYSNEVVAIKKMSYNGKQTTEVRKTNTHRKYAKLCLANPRCNYKCITTIWWLCLHISNPRSHGHLARPVRKRLFLLLLHKPSRSTLACKNASCLICDG